MRRAVAVAVALVAALGCPVVASPNGLGRLPLLGWSTWCTSASCGQPSNSSQVALDQSYHDFCDEVRVRVHVCVGQSRRTQSQVQVAL
jgi:hypothetical protein